MVREPPIGIPFEQDDHGDRRQPRDLGHVPGECETTGAAGLEIDDDRAWGQRSKSSDGLAGIRGRRHFDPSGEPEAELLGDLRIVRNDEEDAGHRLRH